MSFQSLGTEGISLFHFEDSIQVTSRPSHFNPFHLTT